MNKKRCKTRLKIKKNKKQNHENYTIIENKYEYENTNLILCQKEECSKEWNNVIEMKELGKFFFCYQHANDFEEELPNIINNLPEEKAKKIVEANKN